MLQSPVGHPMSGDGAARNASLIKKDANWKLRGFTINATTFAKNGPQAR